MYINVRTTQSNAKAAVAVNFTVKCETVFKIYQFLLRESLY